MTKFNGLSWEQLWKKKVETLLSGIDVIDALSNTFKSAMGYTSTGLLQR